MPIEFYCPGCGNLMRTPDETAGRKGRCPTCSVKVQIPQSSVAATSSEISIEHTATSSRRNTKKPEPIRLDCSRCGENLSIAAANAGKKGECPHCGEIISIPWKSPSSLERWKGTPKSEAIPSVTRTSTAASKEPPSLVRAGGEKIEFHCSNCHEVVRVGAAAAGKRGQCPRCKAVINIPTKSTTVAGLEHISNEQPAQIQSQIDPPTSISGLTPLPSPSPGLSEPTNMEAFDALSPLEPLGLTPLGPVRATTSNSDSFGSDPFAQDLNTYSTPNPVANRLVPARGEARSGAEIATMVCGGFLVFYAVGQIVLLIISLSIQGVGAFSALDQLSGRSEEDTAFIMGSFGGHLVAIALSGVVMLAILGGGIQMLRLKAWGLCLAACILTMLPCNCFCVLGLPLGIWGTVMLSLSSVRSAFH
ncbi:MAG: hypothetical protein H6821_01130 [Planctomycetaceae bacterium]|nr:hypothetical protein [Planctomycetales bacterium]MCB9872754.1 hypothetical protein [Planctomycetaceae bacterium]MCB9926240.1 hypothetical protein [Planctomycetaceae bacterium]